MLDLWQFVYERQAIWHRRHVQGLPRERWTREPKLRVNQLQLPVEKLASELFWAKTFRQAFDLFVMPGHGVREFLAYHLTLDMRQWSEDEWAPVLRGCKKGMLACGIRPTLANLIDVKDSQDQRFEERGLDFSSVAAPGLSRLTLSAMENAFCEFHKYVNGGRGLLYRSKS